MKETDQDRDFIRRILIIVTISLTIVATLIGAWYFAEVLLLVFAGILLAIFLRGVGDLLHHVTGLGPGIAFAVSSFLFLFGVGAIVLLFGPLFSAGIDQLLQSLPGALERIRQGLSEYEWARQVIERAAEPVPAIASGTLRKAAGIFSSTLGLLVSLFIMLILGLYLGAEPRLYVNGLVSLLPAAKRPGAMELLEELNRILRWWLVARMMSMAVVGVLTWLGLMMLNVPLALILGIVAALLSFIPNVGPVLSAIPAVLIGLTVDFWTAIYVAILYVVVQTVESYLITPLLQQRIIAMPPALFFAVQIAMGIAFGPIGLLLAAPLAVVLIVLVKLLYVQGLLDTERG